MPSPAQFCSFVIFFPKLTFVTNKRQSTFNPILLVCEPCVSVYRPSADAAANLNQQNCRSHSESLLLPLDSGLLTAHGTSLMDWQKLRWAPGPARQVHMDVWCAGEFGKNISVYVFQCVCMACCSSLSFMLVFIRRAKWVLCNTTGRSSAHLSFCWLVGQLDRFISSGFVLLVTTMIYIYQSLPVYLSLSIYLSIYIWKAGNFPLFLLAKLSLFLFFSQNHKMMIRQGRIGKQMSHVLSPAKGTSWRRSNKRLSWLSRGNLRTWRARK